MFIASFNFDFLKFLNFAVIDTTLRFKIIQSELVSTESKRLHSYKAIKIINTQIGF